MTNFNDRLLLISRKFDRVCQQVLKDLADETLVAVSFRQLLEHEVNLTLLATGRFLLNKSRLREFGHINLAKNKLLSPETRKSQQAVDQLPHFVGVLPNDFKQTPAFIIERTRILLDQD